MCTFQFFVTSYKHFLPKQVTERNETKSNKHTHAYNSRNKLSTDKNITDDLPSVCSRCWMYCPTCGDLTFPATLQRTSVHKLCAKTTNKRVLTCQFTHSYCTHVEHDSNCCCSVNPLAWASEWETWGAKDAWFLKF